MKALTAEMLLNLLMILALGAVAGAGTVWFEPGAGAGYNVELGRYEVLPETTVKINIAADVRVVAIDVGAIAVNNTGAVTNQGVSSTGTLNTKLTYGVLSREGVHQDGTERNIVIYAMGGSVGWQEDPADSNELIATPDCDPGEALYSFEVLAGEEGTTIEIDDVVGPPSVNPYGPHPLMTFVSSPGGDFFDYDMAPLLLFVNSPDPLGDSDGDGTANADDGCPYDAGKIEPGDCDCGTPDTDTDADGIADCIDNCPDIANLNQDDRDGDGKGDLCDNCPNDPNADQTDTDGDGIGDACDCLCLADFNNDGQVDLEDLQAVAGILLQAGSPFVVQSQEGDCSDLNNDGQIDLEDLQAVAGLLLNAGSPFIVLCTWSPGSEL